MEPKTKTRVTPSSLILSHTQIDADFVALQSLEIKGNAEHHMCFAVSVADFHNACNQKFPPDEQFTQTDAVNEKGDEAIGLVLTEELAQTTPRT